MKMQLRRLVQAASITGVALVVMAASATAYPISFNTSASGTGFGAGGGLGLSLNSAPGGQAATLVFAPNMGDTQGGPTNINLGSFTLACATCGAFGSGLSATFAPFTLEMILTDVTDGGTGKFIGSSTGGEVFTGVSQIDVFWVPLSLGPGTNNALSGSFGPSVFTIDLKTLVVSPTSGTTPGLSTVQGTLSSSAVPEPATVGLVGAALLGLGLLGRKKPSK